MGIQTISLLGWLYHKVAGNKQSYKKTGPFKKAVLMNFKKLFIPPLTDSPKIYHLRVHAYLSVCFQVPYTSL